MGFAIGQAGEKLQARDGFQFAMGHEWHPSERQHQNHHSFQIPHNQLMLQDAFPFNTFISVEVFP